jgi:hypothetical protein
LEAVVQSQTTHVVTSVAENEVTGHGFPTATMAQPAYDDADLNRAIQAYRFFYPTVSGLAMFKGSLAAGLVPNRVFASLPTQPMHVGFTLNSDTPYGPMLFDLRDGPLVVEVPAGPLICVFLDINQRWVADMGLPGPDAATEVGTYCCRRTGAARCLSATTCGARRASASSEASARCRSEATSRPPPNA